MDRLVISLLIAGILVAVTPASGVDDAYLKMLEGEAADLQLDNSGQLKKEKPAASRDKNVFEWNGNLVEEEIPLGLGQEQFEAFLKKNFYGTYVFFNKLNTTDKNTVFFRYSQAVKPDLENVRKNVMVLLKQ